VELLERGERARNDAERGAFMRLREQVRLRVAAAREEHARKEAALKAQHETEAARKRKEERIQTKLWQKGLCVAGLRWIKQAHGDHCAGGWHFIDNAALGVRRLSMSLLGCGN
jgi:hypothetical protein